MQLREVGVAGYRSLHALRFPVGQLTVFVGPNGVGKTTDFGIRWLRPRRRVCHPGAHSRRHSRAQPGNRGRVSRRTSRRSVAGRTAWFGLIFPDYPKRVFEAAELSDGTLHFLGLAGTLLGYRLPT